MESGADAAGIRLRSFVRQRGEVTDIPSKTAAGGGMRAIALAMLACAGCAGGPPMPKLPAVDAAALVPASVTAAAATLTHEPSRIETTSAEVYSRIARGANACWFGARGRLKPTHIFHADAAPSMNGGAVEIVVHERAIDQPKPWGYKAFRVTLAEGKGIDGAHGAGGTEITVENLRMSDEQAPVMRWEVFHWAKGGDGCKVDLPEPEQRPAPPAKTATKKKPTQAATSPPAPAAQAAAAKASAR